MWLIILRINSTHLEKTNKHWCAWWDASAIIEKNYDGTWCSDRSKIWHEPDRRMTVVFCVPCYWGGVTNSRQRHHGQILFPFPQNSLKNTEYNSTANCWQRSWVLCWFWDCGHACLPSVLSRNCQNLISSVFLQTPRLFSWCWRLIPAYWRTPFWWIQWWSGSFQQGRLWSLFPHKDMWYKWVALEAGRQLYNITYVGGNSDSLLSPGLRGAQADVYCCDGSFWWKRIVVSPVVFPFPLAKFFHIYFFPSWTGKSVSV